MAVAPDGLARLEFFGWGIRVRGKVLLRRLLPTWEARFEELSSARPLSAPLGRQGMYFVARNVPTGSRSRDGGLGDRIVFWTRPRAEIVVRLEQFGVRADFSEVRIRRSWEIDELPR